MVSRESRRHRAPKARAAALDSPANTPRGRGRAERAEPFPWRGGEGCVSACKGGGRPLLFPAGPPSAPVPVEPPAGRRSGRCRSAPAGDAKGLSEKAAAFPRFCLTAHLSCRSLTARLSLPRIPRHVFPPEEPSRQQPQQVGPRSAGAPRASLPPSHARGSLRGWGGAQSPSGPRRGDSAE